MINNPINTYSQHVWEKMMQNRIKDILSTCEHNLDSFQMLKVFFEKDGNLLAVDAVNEYVLATANFLGDDRWQKKYEDEE